MPPQLTTLAVLLASPDVHLLSIVGPGGMGDAPGAGYSPPANTTAPRLQRRHRLRRPGPGHLDFVVLAIAAALGINLAPGTATRARPSSNCWSFLRPRQLLLEILDNLEHLLKDSVASLVLDAPERRSIPMTLLTTSRQRLNLREEQLYALAGLHYPMEPGSANSMPNEGFAATTLLLAAIAVCDPISSSCREKWIAWGKSAE